MLNSFKRLITPPSTPLLVDWSDVSQWAESQGFSFRRERGDRGFVIEGQVQAPDPIGVRAWRLEWGPPQRHYLLGQELRIRGSLGLPQELQMLLMTTDLVDTLEQETFSRFTEQAQTEIDLSMPEEMRWLALFRRVNLQPWERLRTRIDAVAAIAGTAEGWLQDTSLQSKLESTLETLDPLLLMTLRGRLYLRTRLETPHVPTLGAVIALYTAGAQALGAVLDSIGRRSGQGFASSSEVPEPSSGWTTADGSDEMDGTTSSGDPSADPDPAAPNPPGSPTR
jgi:hypothetical protein